MNINAFLSYILRTANYIEAKDNLKRLLIYGIKQNQGDEYFKLTNDKD